MTRIISLEATNFKRLKAVRITPDGDLVVISGRNGQGKTSVLDAMTAALGGANAKNLPRPIRDGAGSAEIVIETEDMIITRTFSPSGPKLVVKGLDGLVIPKGQAKLDALLGKLSLDPLAFTLLDDKAQLKTLLDLVTLDFDPAELEAQRTSVFEDRTVVNRDLKALLAQQATFAVFPADVPTAEVSVSDLLEILDAAKARELNYEGDLRRQASAQALVEQLKLELKQAEVDLIGADADLAKWDGFEAPSVDAVRDQIQNIETINAQAREYAAYQQVTKRAAAVKLEADALTAELEAIDKRKRDGLAKAKFPGGLPLGFDETGVLLNGIPFKQASGAEQLRASLAMAIALNPALRVIRIADGSLLDSEGLKMVAEMATAADCQVWIEVVSDGDGFGFMIEDGEVLDPDLF